MTIWIYALVSAVAVSSVSLLGALGFLVGEQSLKKVVDVLVSLAVGVMLGGAFIHLLPQALEQIRAPRLVSFLALVGVLLFFVLEKVVQWQHRHDVLSTDLDQRARAGARMILVGDAFHNFIDGCIIASSYLVSPLFGLATTVAIVAHEVPQEIGDVAVLLHGGYQTKRAVWLNFLSSLTVIPGVLLTLLLSLPFAELVVFLLPVAAGGFLYIAASDLIPQLHAIVSPQWQCAQAFTIGVGVVLISCALLFEDHLESRVPEAPAPPVSSSGMAPIVQPNSPQSLFGRAALTKNPRAMKGK